MAKSGPAQAGESSAPTDAPTEPASELAPAADTPTEVGMTREQLLAAQEADNYRRGARHPAGDERNGFAINEPTETPGE